jgi:hypothetical protein
MMDAGLPGGIPLYGGVAADHVLGAACGPCASTPVSPRRGSNRRYKYLLAGARPCLSRAFDLPPSSATTRTPKSAGEVGKVGGPSIPRPTWKPCQRDFPWTGQHLHDHQRPASVLLAMYIAWAKAGWPATSCPGHPERHPQGSTRLAAPTSCAQPSMAHLTDF